MIPSISQPHFEHCMMPPPNERAEASNANTRLKMKLSLLRRENHCMDKSITHDA